MGAAEKLPHFFTENEVADYLQISVITLARYRKAGKIECTTQDGVIGYTEKQIISFLERCSDPKKMPTALYRHFSREGVLLYVGISLSAIYRIAQHTNSSHWARDIASVTIEWFESTDDALRAELHAIESEMPKHNIRGVKHSS